MRWFSTSIKFSWLRLLCGGSHFLVQLILVRGAYIEIFRHTAEYDFGEDLFFRIFGVENSGDDAVLSWLFPRKMSFYLANEFESLIMCSQQKRCCRDLTF